MELQGISINPLYRITMIGEGSNQWALVVPQGQVLARNTILIGSSATGGADFFADETCYDGGGNDGWIFIHSPNVITNNPSGITSNRITAHSTYTLVDSEVFVTRRGFCWVKGYGLPTVLDSVVYTEGAYASGNYSLNLISLDQGEAYTIRAYVVIGGAVYYGNAITAYTLPIPPMEIEVEDNEGTATIKWEPVERAHYYTLYYSTTAGVTKESTRYVGVVSPFIHPNLIPGRTYHYRMTTTTNGFESELSIEVSVLITGEITLPEFSPANYLPSSEYVKLLTSEYQLAENYKTWLKHTVDYCADITNIAVLLHEHFDLDFAVGKQLDIIGSIVGISRVLPFQPSDDSNPILDDEVYRKLIKATIVRNHWDGQLKTIEEKWREIFPGTQLTIKDNQDMSIDVGLSGDISFLLQDLIMHDMILPRPQAVQVNYAWAPRKLKRFAYDLSTNEFGGYNEAAWVAGS
jgi:hypothetical protein